MTIDQYLEQLRHAVRSLPPDDAAQAVAYYDEYLHDASDPDATMAGLGTPKEVAAEILADYVGKTDSKPRIGVLWAVVLGIFAAPVAAPLAIGLFAGVMGLVIGALAIVLALFVTAVSLVGGGLWMVVTGCLVITQSLTTFAWFVGGGLLLVAVGLLAAFGMIQVGRLAVRGLARWVGGIIDRIRGRRTPQEGQAS
ncbi:MAG: DUF1700 domain-containing protein [Propionibacteriaceae bacterium]|nr:DUF1700 domain-containing protein [Propionibacteriaceae bacterium]